MSYTPPHPRFLEQRQNTLSMRRAQYAIARDKVIGDLKQAIAMLSGISEEVDIELVSRCRELAELLLCQVKIATIDTPPTDNFYNGLNKFKDGINTLSDLSQNPVAVASEVSQESVNKNIFPTHSCWESIVQI